MAIEVSGDQRVSFARFSEVLPLPNLIQMQLDSFRQFQREGIRELFDEISPITDFAGKMSLEFIVPDEPFGKPKYTEADCRLRDTQTRVGRDGQTFAIYKLRTMVRGAEFIGAGLAIQEGDERITRLGRFLRRYSLDELPNLWNVLRGEMSIIGPRPTLAIQVQQYTPRQRGRLAVKPGITGWAQVNGRASLPWSERIELDLWYVEHRSLALDARILGRTIAMVLTGQGLYKGERGGWHPPSP